MTFWFIFIALSALLGMAIVWPLAWGRAEHRAAGEAGAHLRERLGAIERARASGLLEDAEGLEAVIEAKRAAIAAPGPTAPAAAARGVRFAAFVFAGLAPLASAWIYVSIGAPELVGGRPGAVGSGAGADMAPADRAAMIAGMVEGLAARLAENPEDAEGWRMLARSQTVLGDNAKAAEAFRALLARVDGDGEDWRGFAGALIALGPGAGREAELGLAMERLKAFNPNDPMALYFDGEKARAAGDMAAAAEIWRRLLETLPEDAPVRPAIERLIAQAEDRAP